MESGMILVNASALPSVYGKVLEAKKLGFRTCILPKVCLESIGKVEGIELIGVSNVKEQVKDVREEIKEYKQNKGEK